MLTDPFRTTCDLHDLGSITMFSPELPADLLIEGAIVLTKQVI